MQEKVRIKNQRSLELDAVVHIPENRGGGKFPAMILFHGFTGYKEEKHIASFADLLEQNNILAIRFDASGYGGSEGTLEHDYRLSHYISDAEAVHQYLLSRGDVDPLRIGVWGHSMGGIVEIVITSRYPSIKLACIVSSPPWMGSSDRWKSAMPDWQSKGYTERESSRFGKIRIPYSFVEDAQKWNALDYVQAVKVSLLFVVGTEDTVIEPEQTREIFKKAPQPKELLEVPGMDHFYKSNPAILSEVNDTVLKFILKNL